MFVFKKRKKYQHIHGLLGHWQKNLHYRQTHEHHVQHLGIQKILTLINHFNYEKNVLSYQNKEILFQVCKCVPTFSEKDSKSPEAPDNIFIAPVEINQKPKKGIMCLLKQIQCSY